VRRATELTRRASRRLCDTTEMRELSAYERGSNTALRRLPEVPPLRERRLVRERNGRSGLRHASPMNGSAQAGAASRAGMNFEGEGEGDRC
jgi:hypothetical protein